ncbi:hypothetical protein SDC9_137202 [bioreactor metagenome]|uniref:Uncharacterized protein n=1 Tax=bioreactor metagenome TaxID=1076179 RepID=A0A645DL90_9ZZZZ
MEDVAVTVGITAVIQAVQEWRHFCCHACFISQRQIDQELLHTFQMDVDDVFAFRLAEVCFVWFGVMFTQVIKNGSHIRAVRACAHLVGLGCLDAVIKREDIDAQVFDDIVAVKSSCQQLRAADLSQAQVSGEESNRGGNCRKCPSFLEDAFIAVFADEFLIDIDEDESINPIEQVNRLHHGDDAGTQVFGCIG